MMDTLIDTIEIIWQELLQVFDIETITDQDRCLQNPFSIMDLHPEEPIDLVAKVDQLIEMATNTFVGINKVNPHEAARLRPYMNAIKKSRADETYPVSYVRWGGLHNGHEYYGAELVTPFGYVVFPRNCFCLRPFENYEIDPHAPTCIADVHPAIFGPVSLHRPNMSVRWRAVGPVGGCIIIGLSDNTPGCFVVKRRSIDTWLVCTASNVEPLSMVTLLAIQPWNEIPFENVREIGRSAIYLENALAAIILDRKNTKLDHVKNEIYTTEPRLG